MSRKMWYPACNWSLAVVMLLLSQAASYGQSQQKPAKHVLVIGMDGTRADALAKAATPHLDKLIQNGAFTDSAQILGTRYQQNNTISGPGWSSILTGVWADKHGVHDNSFKGRNYELFPHFFKHLKRVDPETLTVSLVSWEPIHEFILSEADVSMVEPLPTVKNQVVDLRVSADKLNINTRDGKWHHLVATRKGGLIQLYLDGELAGKIENANEAFLLDGGYFYLGRDPRSGETCFNGQLDDLRLWNRALDGSEITALTTSTTDPAVSRTGLLAEFTFDAASNGASSKLVDDQFAVLDTAGHPDGPFHAVSIEKSTEFKIADARPLSAASGGVSAVMELSGKGKKDHGLRISMNETLRTMTEKDFTIEAKFQTVEPGRNILMGNYAAKAGSLNLELHEGNSIRVYLQPPNAEASSGLNRENERDRIMAENGARILKEDNPDAMFVYFHQVDATGHGIGFSPDVPEYVRAIENVDGHIGTVLNGLRSRPNFEKEDWLVIVCTDHGGYLKGHGEGHDKPEIRQVFLIVSGPSAQVGRIQEQAYLVDVAATALTHLTGGVDKEWQLDGKAVGLKQKQ